jgi:nitroimidazol reductase NimA-like FMN-containing flavoprotein (pyridoxamine 5'-phosphate oxidase superfamily)
MTEQREPVLEPTRAGDDRTQIERLDRIQCWSLLATMSVGRVGITVDGATEIFPVNYTVDRTSSVTPMILFRTDAGTKLTGLAHNPRISFEVDDLDPTDHTGWSIVVKGRAQQIRDLVDPDQRHRLEQFPVEHWYPGPKRHTIRIVPTEVTGRRIRRVDDPSLTKLPTVAEWTDRPVWIPPPAATLAQVSKSPPLLEGRSRERGGG